MFKNILYLGIFSNIFLYSAQQITDHMVEASSLVSRQICHEFPTPEGKAYLLVRATIDDADGLQIKESRKNVIERNQSLLEYRLVILRIYKAIEKNPLPVRGGSDYLFGLLSIYERQENKAIYVGEIFIDASSSYTFYSQGVVNITWDIDLTKRDQGIEKAGYFCLLEKILKPNLGKNLPVLKYDNFRLGIIRDMYTMQWCMPVSKQPLTGSKSLFETD